MKFGHDVTLIDLVYDSDDYGQEVEIPVETIVQADLIQIGRSEFYQAATADFKPELALDLHTFEYGGQKILRFDSAEYTVIRAYRHDREGLDLTELTCERRIGNG